ncbi:MAG: MerR family transcriptional regulator [Deferribacteres bacterium]|nr:MerR family transcriptional regulator [candidate division KSB1 bacterium]MCB9503804.1 MerR family transcriptional regulator [Deferribacteres bacterium]
MESTRYKIGEVSRKLDVAVETIRMYEREGLIVVAKTETGQRYYDDEDLKWLNCIRRLIKEQGLNIEGIRRLLSLMPCWKIRPCTIAQRESCPAFNGAIKPCWMLKDSTQCHCQDIDCRDCAIYRKAHECTNLKEILQQYLQIEQHPVD